MKYFLFHQRVLDTTGTPMVDYTIVTITYLTLLVSKEIISEKNREVRVFREKNNDFSGEMAPTSNPCLGVQ